MFIEKLIHEIAIPEGVTVDCKTSNVKISGPRGDIARKFEHDDISFTKKKECIRIIGEKLRRKEKALIGTWKAHVSNMIKGVNIGFQYQMKIGFAHFPMKVSVKGNRVNIDNFLGERATRKADIAKGVDVNVKGDSVTIEGNDIEGVGQTSANIEKATVVKGRDTRVFQDGIYIVSKGGG